MAEQDQRSCLTRPGPEVGKQLAIALIAEARRRAARRQPGHLVDLAGGLEGRLRAGRRRDPVVDPLGHLAAEVLHWRQPAAECHLERGLLGYLADGGQQNVLAWLQLALGQTPVVVLGPVDKHHLGSATCWPPDDRTGGPHFVGWRAITHRRPGRGP